MTTDAAATLRAGFSASACSGAARLERTPKQNDRKMNRRKFSKLCGMGVTGVALSSLEICAGRAASAGAGWDAAPQPSADDGPRRNRLDPQQAGESEKLPAQVPGDHYSDLLRAGKIPDPYYRDNNKAVQWAAKTGWTYQRTFEATPQQLAMKNVELVCHGLDTLATVRLNGAALGSTNNMFRTWVLTCGKHSSRARTISKSSFSRCPMQAEINGWTEAYAKLHPEVFDPRASRTLARLELDSQGAVPMGLGLVPADPDDGHLEGDRTARLWIASGEPGRRPAPRCRWFRAAGFDGGPGGLATLGQPGERAPAGGRRAGKTAGRGSRRRR